MKLRIDLQRDRQAGTFTAAPVAEVQGSEEPPEDDLGVRDVTLYIDPNRARAIARRIRDYLLSKGETL